MSPFAPFGDFDELSRVEITAEACESSLIREAPETFRQANELAHVKDDNGRAIVGGPQ